MKILISMLGLGDYKPVTVNIPWNDNSKTHNQCIYHQEALLDMIKPDIFWLVGTIDAKNKHATNLKHDNFVEIPKGVTDLEFWEMFDFISRALLTKLSNANGEKYEIHLDLTHGFRIQPFFLSTAVRHVCQLYSERFSLASVYYNIYENGNTYSHLLKVDPILDLEYLAQDLNLLLSYSVAEPLAKRLETLKKVRKNTIIIKLQSELINKNETDKNAIISHAMRDDSSIKILCELIVILRRFGAVVGINHTPTAADTVKKLCEYSVEAGKVFSDELKPAGQALLKLKEELYKLLPQDANPLWGWHAALAKWCLDRGLDQQALTHAEEMITTRACEEAGLEPLDKNNRTKCGTPLKAMGRSENAPIPNELKQLIGAWNAITLRRNGVNHAFTGDPSEQDAEKIRLAITKDVERLLDTNKELTVWPIISF